MNHKKYQTTFWLVFTLILISVLLLAWPPLPTEAGPGLPPRKPPPPVQPSGDDDEEDQPAGAHIVLHVPSAPAGVWTIVQWQDSAGGWHDIDGWQGTLDEGNQKMWWLAPDLFGKGPFRWLVYESTRGDKLLATSELFYLPDAAGEKLWVEMSLSE
ncbi:MAG: hypothetical protein OEW09_01645 [Anaerolineae bacterium]|nr:hypothetical protein [Anaerolineae bacterium]